VDAATTVEPQPSPTHTPVKSESAHRNGFYRTPLQIFLLAIGTLGFYQYYYMIRGMRLAQRRLGQTEQPYWHGLKLIVPILGMIYYFECFSRMGDRTKTAGVQLPVSFAVQVIPLFLINIVWRLPDPYWLAYWLVVLVTMGTIHASVAHAERKDEPSYPWPPFTIWEWLISTIGIGLVVLATIGTCFDSATSTFVPGSTQLMLGVAAFAIVAAILFHVLYGKLRHATPSLTSAVASSTAPDGVT
jgi:hypothetical protein